MRKKKQKRDYECPKCKVHELQIERFICTSVTPSASGSTSPSWGSEQEYGGGTILIGGSSVAPAKQAPSWGEEEEAD